MNFFLKCLQIFVKIYSGFGSVIKSGSVSQNLQIRIQEASLLELCLFLFPSKDGNFVWNDKKEEIKDAWLDDIDWVKVCYNYFLGLRSFVR